MKQHRGRIETALYADLLKPAIDAMPARQRVCERVACCNGRLQVRVDSERRNRCKFKSERHVSKIRRDDNFFVAIPYFGMRRF